MLQGARTGIAPMTKARIVELGGNTFMNKTVISTALTMALLAVGSAPAWGQAAAPAAPTSPVSTPAMSGTLAGNVKPLKLDAGPLGGIYLTGVLSGIAQWQNNVYPGDKTSQVDVTNGQVFIQKVDGLVQFFAEGGAYSLPTVAGPYLRAGNNTSATFGGLPVWFVKLAPNDSFSVQAGNLPTLIGAEYAFSFQNINVQRGLLWFEENIVNRGVQFNYTKGPLALSFAWSDGYFSNRYSWLSGLATYTIDPANTVAFSAGGTINTETVASYVTPPLQNNSTIYNLIYTHTSGPWTISPNIQYTTVPKDTTLGTTKDATTFGGALYVTYAMDGGYSIAGRAEYLSSNGSDPASPFANDLLYGAGSKAWSFTITPTYQKGPFFARGEFSYVKASSTVDGLTLFGNQGSNTSQTRLLLESGVIF
jgi:hypothetical protein